MAVDSTTSLKKVSSSSHIPYELSLCILSKLPLKSLKRFTCLQKSYSLLFQDPLFFNMFRNNFISKQVQDTGLLLKERKSMSEPHDTMFSLFSDRFDDMVKLDCPPHFQDYDNPYIRILGSSSVNGIICLFNEYDYDNITTVLWNPATRQFKIIPPSLQPYENIEFNLTPNAFGYDSIRDDYKLIHMLQYPNHSEDNWVLLPDKASGLWEMDGLMNDDDDFWDEFFDEGQQVPMYDPFWEIYSLKSNSWRKLDGVDIRLYWPSSIQVNLNELSHWLGSANQMLSFDFINEKFFATTLPSFSDPIVIYKSFRKDLMMLNGSVALICNCDYYFHIWILGELGVTESWTKLFVFGPLTCVNYPIRAGKNNDIYFRNNDGGIAKFNLSTHKFEEIKLHIDQILIFKENLLSIPYLVG